MMTTSKLLIALIAISLVFVPAEEDEVSSLASKQSGELKSKISALESFIVDKGQELKSKDEIIAHLEQDIQEKSVTIQSLKREIESIQKQGALDTEELVNKAHARADELEKQVETLRNEIELQNRKRNSLDMQAGEAETKVNDLKVKLKNLQKTNDEQKLRIQKTERALKVAKEELMKAHLEASTKSKELSQAHGAWFPPWLATHFCQYQELAITHWKEHARPAVDLFFKKAARSEYVVQIMMEPHFKAVKTEWLPIIKEHWVILVTSAEPYVQTVTTKTVEFYHTSKSTIATHVSKVQKLADPHFQVAKEFSKPYVYQVATITKPHVQKVRDALRPYKKQVVHLYGKFWKSTTTYHLQVQAGIQEHFEKSEYTKPLATKEFLWFLASALLVLPIFLVYRLLSKLFCSRKATKQTRNTRANRAHRRHKHKHANHQS